MSMHKINDKWKVGRVEVKKHAILVLCIISAKVERLIFFTVELCIRFATSHVIAP